MIQLESSVVLDELLSHVAEQQSRSKLIDKPFELGIMSNKRPSQILNLVRENEAIFREIGMKNFQWYDDALRSSLKIAGEEVLFSISHPR